MLIGIVQSKMAPKEEDAPRQRQQGLVEVAREANLRGALQLANLREKRSPSPNLGAEALVEPEKGPLA